jgi:hypothetical protein
MRVVDGNASMSETVAGGRYPVMVGAGIAALLVAGTVGLWAYYGTAVFFEVIRAGFVACFG